MKSILIYDDYNSRILQDQDCIGTITCNVGVSAPRNGFKIIEFDNGNNQQMQKILIDDTYASRNARQYKDVSPTLRSERFGFKVMERRDAQPLKRRRTEEERRRRHLHGDKGATFSKGKESYIGNDGIANTVTTVFSKDNIIAEIMYDTTKNETNTREVLRLLRKEIGEEAFLQKMGRFESILKEEVLRQNVYEESIRENGEQQSGVLSSTPLFSQDSLLGRGEGDEMRNVRINKECRCASQGWQLSEQYTRELDACLSELSYESPQSKEVVCYLRTACQSPQSMRQTLSALEEVRRPESQAVEYQSKKRYRIRKLTARECFRLMDVCESDIDKIQNAGISESQQYKMAGNSIVVACMEGIFRNLFSTDQQERISLF